MTCDVINFKKKSMKVEYEHYHSRFTPVVMSKMTTQLIRLFGMCQFYWSVGPEHRDVFSDAYSQ